MTAREREQALQGIVSGWQCAEVEGVEVDALSANLILWIGDRIQDRDLRERFWSRSVLTLDVVAARVLDRLPVTISFEKRVE